MDVVPGGRDEQCDGIAAEGGVPQEHHQEKEGKPVAILDPQPGFSGCRHMGNYHPGLRTHGDQTGIQARVFRRWPDPGLWEESKLRSP